ncbi:MAG: hypothetical protein ACPHLK_08645 [Gammaproteobacteria bacterium]|jgi:hypothetical protein
MKKKPLNSQTAYEHNAHGSVSNAQVKNHGWSSAINRMIDQRYAFLGLQYEEDGYLFRGMNSGLLDAIVNNQFWHYVGDDRGNHLEKELNVLFVSQDFSDALTVSKLWQAQWDACIIIFKSKIFNNALINKNAAMMATAEPGVIFKYPFLCQALSFSDIEKIIVSTEFLTKLSSDDVLEKFSKTEKEQLLSSFNQLQNENKIIQVDIKSLDFERSAVEKEILRTLSKTKIEGAKTIKSDLKPA